METGSALSIHSIATEWHSGQGGITTFNRELCSALARLGHQVFCGVPKITESDQHAAKTRNVHLVAPTPVPGMDGIEALARPFQHVGPIDIVIGHGRITGRAAVAQVTDTLRTARYVHFVHMDPNAIEWDKHGDDGVDATATAEQRRDLEIALSLRANLIVAVGPELHGAYAMYLQPHSRRPHLFLPGLFASDWTPSPSGHASCLLFGRAEDAELKGLTVAAQAMGDVCRAPGPLSFTRLVVRGSRARQGDQLQKKLTEASGGMTSVVVQEYTADAGKILDDIRRASLVLMPSRQEGFGLSGLEAISEGIPVLLSHTSGLAQAITTYVPQVAPIHIVDLRGGHSALAERIRERLSDRESAFANARALRDAMRPHFNWDAATKDLLDALASAPSPPSGDGHGPSVAPLAHSSSVALADTLASASSALFAWRQTLRTTDQWIERPELARILEHVRDKAARPLVLLGPPGSGKSALMARCATQLRAEGVAVLGIKADALPNTVDTLSALAAELSLPRNITTAIAAVAEIQSTVLFIDQLDALADLVDLRTERLSILLVLAMSLAEAGVQVVMSCRDFDFAHDVRFEQLDAEELRLEPPTDETMKEVLTANEIDPPSLTQRLRELGGVPRSGHRKVGSNRSLARMVCVS